MISLLFIANAKSVSYLIAADGNPWVWVLEEGEDKPDYFEVFKSKYSTTAAVSSSLIITRCCGRVELGIIFALVITYQ